MHSFPYAALVIACVLVAVDVMCPKQLNAFKTSPLSTCTVTRLLEDPSLFTKFKTLDIISIALKESCACDITKTAQLAIFALGVTQNEFLSLIPRKGMITGQDVCSALLPASSGFSLSKLNPVTTDGAPAMIKVSKGPLQLVIDHCYSFDCAQEKDKMYCIVHQESLCAKAAGMMEHYTCCVEVNLTVWVHCVENTLLHSSVV